MVTSVFTGQGQATDVPASGNCLEERYVSEKHGLRISEAV